MDWVPLWMVKRRSRTDSTGGAGEQLHPGQGRYNISGEIGGAGTLGQGGAGAQHSRAVAAEAADYMAAEAEAEARLAPGT